jgi:hypothetical protein
VLPILLGWLPFSAEDLSESFQDISAELRSQYSLAYRSSRLARDGSFRAVKIETDRKNLRVKARKGYQAARGDILDRLGPAESDQTRLERASVTLIS